MGARKKAMEVLPTCCIRVWHDGEVTLKCFILPALIESVRKCEVVKKEALKLSHFKIRDKFEI